MARILTRPRLQVWEGSATWPAFKSVPKSGDTTGGGQDRLAVSGYGSAHERAGRAIFSGLQGEPSVSSVKSQAMHWNRTACWVLTVRLR